MLGAFATTWRVLRLLRRDTYRTRLAPLEVESRLQEATVEWTPYRFGRSIFSSIRALPPERPFELKRGDGVFHLRRLRLMYSNLSLPVVVGRTQERPTGTMVEVVVQLPRATSILLVPLFGFLAVLFLSALTLGLLGNLTTGETVAFTLQPALFGLVVYAFELSQLHREARFADAFLRRVLDSRPMVADSVGAYR